MHYLEMSNPFFRALDIAGLRVRIRQFPGWDDFQGAYCMGGEL